MDYHSSAQDLYQLASATRPGRTDEDTVVLTCIFNNIIYSKLDFFFLAETNNSPTNHEIITQDLVNVLYIRSKDHIFIFEH